jgi:hypothetical protein
MTMASNQHPTIFVSHAGEDSEVAKSIANGLSLFGIKARLDQLEIKTGESIINWIYRAVSESDYLLVLLSPHALNKYWIEREWLNGLMREAQLKRVFVIPALLPGLEDRKIPYPLLEKKYIDFREDTGKAFLELVSRLREDTKDLVSNTTIIPSDIEEESENDKIEAIIHSNRLGLHFRLVVPADATPTHIIQILREKLKLKFVNLDETLGYRMSYAYCLFYEGEPIAMNETLGQAGVKDGDRLDLWTRVSLEDLVENRGIIFRICTAYDFL